MAISKVILNGVTQMDATGATAGASDIVAPKSAMLANGVLTTGTGSASVEEIYDVTYGTTTSTEIEAAYQANKLVRCIYSNKEYLLTYRESATIHHFVVFHNQARYALKCDNDTWSDSTSTFAKKDSPQLTGTPTAPTATAGTNTTQLATTAFVQTAVGGAIPLPQSASDGQFLTYNGTSGAWVATTVPSANGVSF